MDIKTPYVRYEKNITENGYKLLCIPYAGRGASYFCGWQKAFGDEIEVLPIQLPGRENRMKDDLLRSCCGAAEQIAENLKPFVESHHFSVFGHSMGGIIAFEVAKKFEALGYEPDACFISATSLKEDFNFIPSRELGDQDFFERVEKFGGIDESNEILNYPEFREIFLRILRADFEIIETYKNDGTKLKCPIIAAIGDQDPMENAKRMQSWKDCTESEFIFRQYPGGHFYIADQLPAFCNDMKKDIAARSVYVK